MLAVTLHRRAHKQLKKLPTQVQRRIGASLKNLAEQNHPLDHQHVIKLAGRGRADFRLRVGDYRIKFTLLASHEAFITGIEHRQAGY